MGIADLAVQAYGFASRLGVLDNPIAHRLFVRSYFAYKRYVEDPFAGLVRRHPELFRGGDILDIGANVGYTATVFARALSPGRKVWAFEPEARNFEALEGTVRRFDLGDRVIPVRAAVGEQDGVVELWRNPGHPGDHRVITDALRVSSPRIARTPGITAVSVDGFAEGHGFNDGVAFIKIDVQGYEVAVCRGMQRTIEKSPDVFVAVEYAPAILQEMGFPPAELLEFYTSRRFNIWSIERDGTLVPRDIQQPLTNLGPRGYVDLLCARASIATSR